MKTTKYTLAILLVAIMAVVSGCKKTYDDPPVTPPAEMQANTTIMQFKGLYTGGPTVIEDPNIIITGKVISTDRYGNFYRSIYIEDESSGIEVKIGRTTLYNTYKVGQIIYVKPYQLCLGKYGGLLQLGYPSSDTKYETAYMDDPTIIRTTIFKGEQSTPVVPQPILAAADITDARLSTLVTLQGATYKGGTGGLTTWAVKDNPDTPEDDSEYGEQNFTLSDGKTNVVVRTSGYAKFAETPVPFAVGTKVNITGVLTRYNTTNQLILNTDKDVIVVQ